MKPVSRDLIRTAAIGLSLSLGMAASAQAEGFKMGYAVGFLTDPFQADPGRPRHVRGRGRRPRDAAGRQRQRRRRQADHRHPQPDRARAPRASSSSPTTARRSSRRSTSPSREGVPVVSIDIGPDGGKVDDDRARRQHRHGRDRLQVRWARRSATRARCCRCMGDQTSINGRDRTTGFNDCMTRNFPDIKLIEQPTDWDADRAGAAAQTVHDRQPRPRRHLPAERLRHAAAACSTCSRGRAATPRSARRATSTTSASTRTPAGARADPRRRARRRHLAAARPLRQVRRPRTCRTRSPARTCAPARPTTAARSSSSTAT